MAYEGLVMNGDWDTHKEPYSNESRYQSFKAHFDEDTPLEETDYGQTIVERYNSPQHYFEYVDDLYRSLQKNGYDTCKSDGIAVNVGRNGEFIFNNNHRHRLALSKIIGLDKIPVKIIVTHGGYL